MGTPVRREPDVKELDVGLATLLTWALES